MTSTHNTKGGAWQSRDYGALRREGLVRQSPNKTLGGTGEGMGRAHGVGKKIREGKRQTGASIRWAKEKLNTLTIHKQQQI